jgi:NitT/TauT family transport system permease protein
MILRLRMLAPILWPLAFFLGLVLIWSMLAQARFFPPSIFPAPADVVRGFAEEIASGRIVSDLLASLFRVSTGFLLASVGGAALGVWMGRSPFARWAFLPAVNFFRNLSPLAWVPFAILWFGIGDMPAIFLIFLSAFFPVAMSTLSAVLSIPSIYYRIAAEHRFTRSEILFGVTLPAIAPQLITALRVAVGISWLVVVAAEMIVGREGLGFAIWDARNGLRTDLLVVEMVVIGCIGVVLDRSLRLLTRLNSVRWGYEQ